MDRAVDISDPIVALERLFLNEDRDVCVTLCDVDGDGELSLSDPIAILQFLYQGDTFRVPLPAREEFCDGIDTDCDGATDEDCPQEGGVSVQLAWDPVTKNVQGSLEDVAGYKVHFGRSPGGYPHVRDAHGTPQYKLSGLIPLVRYYFAVTAYDRAGNTSDYSNEVSVLAGR